MTTELNKDVIEFIESMVKKYPNDTELGVEIRKIYDQIKTS